MRKIKYAAGGGGTAGIVHIGALKAMVEAQMEITSIIGVSAGAIFGAIFQYQQLINNNDIEKTFYNMNEIFMDLNFRDFADTNWFYRSILSILKNPEKAGLYKGKSLYNWLRKQTDDIRFVDIPMDSLFVVATEMYSGSLAVFSPNTSPSLTLAKAVRASSSIQGYFRPAQINYDEIKNSFFFKNTYSIAHNIPPENLSSIVNDNNKMLFWDGGNLGNCRNDIAVKIWEYDTPVIGVSLTEDPKLEIKNFNIFGVLSKTIDIMMSSMENVVISLSKAHSNRPDYLIKPDRFGVSATEFDIDDELKLKLIQSGYGDTKKLIEERL